MPPDAQRLLGWTWSRCLLSLVWFTAWFIACIPENLTSSADAFRVKARGLQRQMWWKECRVFLHVFLFELWMHLRFLYLSLFTGLFDPKLHCHLQMSLRQFASNFDLFVAFVLKLQGILSRSFLWPSEPSCCCELNAASLLLQYEFHQHVLV